MIEYRCHALDTDNAVRMVEVVKFEHDDLARLRAAIILANCDYPTVEAWERDRLVCRISKPGHHDKAA
jgi:hypothetical protein